MEIKDRRTVVKEGLEMTFEGLPEPKYDDFTPTLAGFQPLFDAVLLRELKLPDEGMIATPDAYAEPCLYCEVIAGGEKAIFGNNKKAIARILKGIGTTIPFSDANGERYLTVHAQDIIGVWQQ